MKLSNSLALFISASLLVLTACGSSTIGGGTGAGGDGTGTGGTGTGGEGIGGVGGTTGGTGGGVGGCASLDEPEKECTVDADCVTALHQINCCGTSVAIGVSASAAAAYSALEEVCAAEFPKCGCPTMPTQAEDGQTSADFNGSIPVRCDAGLCKTYIPNGLCLGAPSPVSCTENSCPPGYVCTPDIDSTTCHPSACSCDIEGWVCTADCGMLGSTCVQGL